MIQNLKVDIIYHSTSSDFEMEFNLCGCCRMRLLSDKTNDKKGFVKALARDVARSRVIIACGPIFGDDGLISIVGTAIGNGLALCDNKTYGINSDEPIHIINGSTPLVTPDGYFGGCIIESGPQTIILLTENRTFRKSIMQNLIHPYIEEISYIPPKESPENEPPTPNEAFETAVTPNEEYIISDEDYTDDTPQTEQTPTLENTDEHNIEFIMDAAPEDAEQQEAPTEAEDTSATDEISLLMYTEVESQEEIASRYENPYQPSESDNMFIASSEPDDDTPQQAAKRSRKKRKGLRGVDVAIIILVCLLLLAVIALVYFIVIKPMSMDMSIGQHIKEIFGLASETATV